MEPERVCALGGTNKIVLLRDYRAACIRRVLSSARELLQEKIPFLSSLTFSLLLSSSILLRPLYSFRSFPVDFSTSESSRLLVTQKTKASSTVISSMVTKPRVLFFIRLSIPFKTGTTMRERRVLVVVGKWHRSILFYVAAKGSFRNLRMCKTRRIPLECS